MWVLCGLYNGSCDIASATFLSQKVHFFDVLFTVRHELSFVYHLYKRLFHPGQENARFFMENVALGQVFLLPLRFSPVSVIPWIPHTHPYFNTSPGIKTIVKRLKGSNIAKLFLISGNNGEKSILTLFSLTFLSLYHFTLPSPISCVCFLNLGAKDPGDGV
jgi:hypothetical protein